MRSMEQSKFTSVSFTFDAWMLRVSTITLKTTRPYVQQRIPVDIVTTTTPRLWHGWLMATSIRYLAEKPLPSTFPTPPPPRPPPATTILPPFGCDVECYVKEVDEILAIKDDYERTMRLIQLELSRLRVQQTTVDANSRSWNVSRRGR